MGEKVFHVEQTDTVDIGKVAGGLLGGANKDQIANHRHFATLTAVLQLGDHYTRGKVIVYIQVCFGLKTFQRFTDSKFLLVTSAGSKPIFLIINQLK